MSLVSMQFFTFIVVALIGYYLLSYTQEVSMDMAFII